MREVNMMTDIASIRRLSCYAVLNIGYSGENYLFPHLRLVLALIASKNLKSVEARELVKLFKTEYQYTIDFFPMRSILSLAVTQGYLERIHNRKHYRPTSKLSGFTGISEEIGKSESELYELTLAFKDFAAINDVKYSLDEVNTIIVSYINTQKLSHISGHIETPDGDKRTDYLFGKFVYDIKEHNPHLMEFLTKLVTGSILADCLMFHEQMENGRLLEGVTIVFDTALVFMALGIDEAKRQEHYTQLICALKEKGARVVMFQHSYNEMQYIILGAADWVENPLYDPLKSSETTAYFRSIHASRDEVIEYSTALKQHICDAGIEIIDVNHNQSLHPYHEDETRIYSMIVDKYAATNPYFDEAQQKPSMELDARSISYIYLLRRGQLPMYLSDCEYLFVTANRSLNKVAADYHRASGKLDRSLPSSVTDVFLGTYIWLSDPVKITKMNERLMIANAYLAFQPNKELISKLSTTVNTLLKKGEISSDICYALMGNKLVLDKLAEKTLGNPDAYHENTPLEILQEMMEKSKRAGASEAEQQFNAWKQTNAIEQAKQHHEFQRQSEKLAADLMHMTQTALKSSQNELTTMEVNRKKARRYRKIWNIGIALAAMLWLVLNIAICMFIWKYDVVKTSNWLDLYTVVITTLITAMPFVFTCITNQEINVQKAIKKFLDKRFDRKCKKLSCTDTLIEKKELEIEDLEKKLRVYGRNEPAA